MLASLIGGFISGETLNMLRRLKSAAIAYLLVALFAAIGVGFLIGAGYIYVAQEFGSLTAAISFGVGFLLIATIILIVHSIRSSRAKRRRDKRGIDLATIAGAAAITGLPILLRSRAGLVGPLAAIAAYVIYRENRKRKLGDSDDELT